MELKILIFKLFFIIIFTLFINNLHSAEIIGGIARVIDGDTIHIKNNKIRLHGIDAPEHLQKCLINKKKWNCGIEATKFLKNLIKKKSIDCEIKDIDKYNRFIGICFLENLNINQTIVRSGWAIAYRYYSKDYIVDEEFAKINKSGIWAGEFEEPYSFRKKNRK